MLSINSEVTSEVKTEKELNDFLQSLNDKQKIAFDIAKKQLGTSFDIYRCNGFIDWKKKKQQLLQTQQS